MNFNMAHQVNRGKKKPISNSKGRIKFVELRNSGPFHFHQKECITSHATISKLTRGGGGTAFGEQLKVQKSVHTQPFFLPTPQPPLTTIPVHQNKILEVYRM